MTNTQAQIIELFKTLDPAEQREVVPFPMNQRAEDLLMGAPSEVSPKQLRELHIRLNLPEKT